MVYIQFSLCKYKASMYDNILLTGPANSDKSTKLQILLSNALNGGQKRIFCIIHL